jgi:hypothetical protein
MFQSDPGQPAGLHRQAQRDARGHAVRRSGPGIRPHTAWFRAGTRLSRLAAALAAVTVGLLASVAAIPAAFAQGRQATADHAVTTGGLATWQIALIGVGIPLALAVVGIAARRIKAARRAASWPAA